MTVRLGVIGAGSHSRLAHAPALHALSARADGDAVALAAVCDLDRAKAEAYAREFDGAQVYTDADRMLNAETLDGLLVVSPLQATETIVSSLIPRRLPLLIEKPPGTTAAATARLLELARTHDTPHMISFNRRFNPVMIKARQWLEAGGTERRPKMVLGRMLRHARHDDRFVVGTGIHLIDTLVSLLGAPHAIDTIQVPTANPACPFFCGRMTYGEDCMALATIAPAVGRKEEALEIYGHDYCLKLDVGEQTLALWQQNELTWSWRVPDSSDRQIADVIHETEAFVNAIKGEGPYWPDLNEGLISMRVVEAMQSGSRVAFGGERPESVQTHPC